MGFSSPTDNEAIRELRDEVKKLNKIIGKFNKQSSRQSEVIIALTFAMLLVAIFQVLFSAFADNLSVWISGLAIAALLIAIVKIVKLVTPKK